MSSTSQRQDTQPRYFCYACDQEVPIYMAPDPTCQRCNEQFVQEIEPENDPRSFLNGDGDAAATTATADAGQDQSNAFFRNGSQNGSDLFQFLDALGQREGSEDPNEGNNGNRSSSAAMSAMLQNMVTMLLSQPPDFPQGGDPTDEEGEEARQPGTQQQQQQPLLFYGGMVDGHLQFRPMNLSPQQQQQQQQQGEAGEEVPGSGDGEANTAQSATEEGTTEGDGARGGDRVNNFASGLLRLLYGLSEGVVGNPSDYVFSQDGFDNIITQLMEQASGRNAPPPAPETVIDTLPKRKLTDKEIADVTDCAVCKDEFVPTEEAIELPCQHLFHEDCIKPWLKVNGTCPVCRHSVAPEKKGNPEGVDTSLSENNNNNTGADNGNGSSTNQTASSSNEAPNSPPPVSEGVSPTFSSLLGDPRRPIPSLAGWFSRRPMDAARNNLNNNNQEQPFTSSPSFSSPNNSGSSSNNHNTPQQLSSNSNNQNNSDHSEMDLDLD